MSDESTPPSEADIKAVFRRIERQSMLGVLKAAVRAADGGYRLTFIRVPGWPWRLLGFGPTERCYVGRSTVWHEWPEFNRCGTRLEAALAEEYERLEYERRNGGGMTPEQDADAMMTRMYGVRWTRAAVLAAINDAVAAERERAAQFADHEAREFRATGLVDLAEVAEYIARRIREGGAA